MMESLEKWPFAFEIRKEERERETLINRKKILKGTAGTGTLHNF